MGRPFHLYIYRLCFFSNFNRYQIFSICFWIFPISDGLLPRLTALLTVAILKQLPVTPIVPLKAGLNVTA